jgi:hypothetical protein
MFLLPATLHTLNSFSNRPVLNQRNTDEAFEPVFQGATKHSETVTIHPE